MSNTEENPSKMLSLNDYQIDAMSVRLPSADGVYALYGFPAEVGELYGHLAKARRDGRKMEHDLLIKKELGDCLWFIAALAADYGYTLEDVARGNLEKLFSRQSRGTLMGSGDFR